MSPIFAEVPALLWADPRVIIIIIYLSIYFRGREERSRFPIRTIGLYGFLEGSNFSNSEQSAPIPREKMEMGQCGIGCGKLGKEHLDRQGSQFEGWWWRVSRLQTQASPFSAAHADTPQSWRLHGHGPFLAPFNVSRLGEFQREEAKIHSQVLLWGLKYLGFRSVDVAPSPMCPISRCTATCSGRGMLRRRRRRCRRCCYYYWWRYHSRCYCYCCCDCGYCRDP